jgi:hypothetical protein
MAARFARGRPTIAPGPKSRPPLADFRAAADRCGTAVRRRKKKTQGFSSIARGTLQKQTACYDAIPGACCDAVVDMTFPVRNSRAIVCLL